MSAIQGIALGLGLWAGTQPALAQGGFIKHFESEQGGRGGFGVAIREVPTGYLFFCDQIANDGTFQTHATMRRLDPLGEELSAVDLYAGIDRQANFGLCDPVCRMASGNFATALVDDLTGYDRGAFIYVFDEQGDTVVTYHPLQCLIEDSVSITVKEMVQTQDGHFLLVGATDSLPQQLDTHALLVKVSPDGVPVLVKEYGVWNQLFEALAVEEYVDAGAILFGYRGAAGFDNKNFLIRVDSDGEELWRRYFGYKHSGSYGAVEVTPEGDILTWSGYEEPEWPIYYWKVLLTKWDADGEIIWQHRTHYGYYSSTMDMELLDDGTIIATASIDDKGVLCKFDAQGDSTWSRIHSIFSNNANHILWDVEPTADGGFISCGDVVQSGGDPTPGLQTLWIVKTDSMGCVVPGCHTVGVAEYVLDLTEQLRLSPNPASEALHFELPLPTTGVVQGPVTVILQDALGREVQRLGTSPTNNTLVGNMDVTQLAAGTYYLHLRHAQKWLAGAKVVVE